MTRSLDRIRALAKNHPLPLRAAIGLLVLVASLVVFIKSQRVPPVRPGVVDARLELAAGEVRLVEAGKGSTVISGAPLPAGAELATGTGARALVRLSDGSSLFLRGDATVRLQPDGAEIVAGEVWLDAPPSERGGLKHKAGDATIAAADAGLSIRRAGAEVVVVVTRGLAVLTAPGGRVEVNAGEQAQASGNDKPKVSPVLFWDDWTGGMGDGRPLAGAGSGAGRIYGVSPGLAGEKAKVLEVSRQSVRAVIREGLAETEVDQTFGNPGGGVLEGWYWFSVPERAIVTSFAVETNGVLVEGEVTERKEAAAKYATAVATGNSPALLEWIDGRTYRSRIYPIPASGSRRVVLRYLEVLPSQGGKLEYLYPMRGEDPARIGEFSLEVDLGVAGSKMRIASLADAVVEDGGRRVTMRRSGYLPRADFQLEAAPIQPEKRVALTVGRFAAGADRADYVMARYVPDIDWATVPEPPGDVAVVVDTSASGDEAVRQQKAAAAEAILRALSQKDRFVLIAIDSAPTVLWPKDGLAEATDKEIAAALARLAEHASGGATDLGALFDAALGRLHGTEQPAVVYIGDGLPTSGEVSGDRLSERLRRSLSTSRARLFTVAVGTQSNVGLLRELARQGGGQSFRIDRMETATSEVLRLASAIKTPTITELAIDLGAGLDEAMLTASGKVSRGEEVLLFARTHHALPAEATVKGRVGGKDFAKSYPITLAQGTSTSLVPRLWAAEKVRRLLGEVTDPEEQRGKIVEIGLEYGLMTPFTSILALESEAAYARQGIRRRYSPLRGVRLSALDARTERALMDAALNPAPAVAMGCSLRSKEEAPASESVAAAPAPLVVEDKPADQQNETPPATAMATAEPAEPEPAVAGNALSPAKPAPGGGGGAFRGAAEQEGIEALEKTVTRSAVIGPANGDLPALKEKVHAPEAPPPPPTPTATSTFDATKKLPAAPSPRVSHILPPTPCSDVARRPLADRIVMWSKRLRGEIDGKTLVSRYQAARGACEIPDWRAEQALLDLLQRKARTEDAVTTLLAHFESAPDTRAYVAQAILRRSVDPRIAASVRRTLFGEKIAWEQVDAELAAIDGVDAKLAKLRERMLVAPGDPEGDLRVVRLLAEAGKKDDALAQGRRLRDRGFMSPDLALALGDVLAAQGFQDEALRTYSEIVEFDPQSAESRRLLGDVFLRHGWYGAAYRQYKTLTDLPAADAPSFLRLALAASGSGRVDEALRLERQVASAEGTPGPRDPRLWARLWAAAHLGRLLEGEGKPVEPGLADGLSRKLKELSLFSGPSALAILTWEDLDTELGLVGKDGAVEATLTEVSDAASIGISAVELPLGDEARLAFLARFRKASPGRDVPVTLHAIAWDGKAFRVTIRKAKLGAKDTEVTL
ncbi:VIT domain-containing protein [Polyangium jinanense]|uniref:FecR domain-containing protein n=1 Tax=Polyangium jinanense TaxID=2829994 RepID=A0A9X3X9C2_9BACT|nr:VIT domain-containing protein [Polyangium jinanense]MDC3960152.1 FecR domain-containing protein [Polyangium jinanense]MDC3986592.1 FecR domain-containing protein [Polyangium jinanense]